MAAPVNNLTTKIIATLFPWKTYESGTGYREYDVTPEFDISSYIAELSYYENILSPVLTMKAVLVNTKTTEKLSELYPITKDDVIRFNFDDGNSDDFISFTVTSVGKRISVTGIEVLTVNLMSTWSFCVGDNWSPGVPTPGLKKGPTSSIIDQMYKEVFSNIQSVSYLNPGKSSGLKTLHRDASDDTHMYNGIAKEDDLLQFGLYLARCSRLSEKEAGFLFYETRVGHHFASIDKMIREVDEEEAPTYYFNGLSPGPQEQDPFTILSIKGQSANDFALEQARTGGGIRQVAFDIETNQAYAIYLSPEDASKELSSTNKNETKETISAKNGTYRRAAAYNGRVDNLGLIDRDTEDLCKILNSSMLAEQRAIYRYNSLYSIQVLVTVKINTDLQAGQFVKLDIPQKEAQQQCLTDAIINQSKDADLYMIASLCHSVGTDKGYTSLMLVRDKPKTQQ